MQDLDRILKHFRTLCSIPHCSCQAEELREYLADFAKERGYEVQSDATGNLLIRRGSPRLCLQGHYDMVCVGRAPEIEWRQEGRWLSARDSSLGADNGMAVAMMMALIEEGAELEFLLTADEEVGLVGAKALAFDLAGPNLLNLDFEEEGIVCIGCAGGVDLIARKPSAVRADDRPAWRVSLSGLPGGHSGVDIDKEIPNAIKELAQALAGLEGIALVSFRGGEWRNSIPTQAEAVILSERRPELPEPFGVEAAAEAGGALEEGERLLHLLATAPHGVVSRNEELKIPEESLNLAMVALTPEALRIDYSLRAMSDEELEALALRMETLLKRYGFGVGREEAYPAWKPEINPFARRVAETMAEQFGRSEFQAIHAGLECGILSEKYPQIRMASIGPTIENPHSVRERVDLDSVERTYRVLRQIVASA